MRKSLGKAWHWIILLGSGLVLILLSPVVIILKILEKLQIYQMRPTKVARPKVLVIAGVLFVLLLLLFYFQFLPSFWYSADTVLMTIHPGESFSEIATRLKELDLVSSPAVLKLTAEILNLDKKIYAGQYEFQTGQSIFSILDRLSKGGATAINVTIPPGLTVKQIAGIFQDKIGADSGRLVQLTADKTFIQSLDLEAQNLEGFLFPQTYNLYWKTSAEEIIRTMVSEFKKVVFEELHFRPTGVLQGELRDLATVASLIEKEGFKAEEYPLISAVFHNRLKIDMPLQCDPTILYVLPPLNRPIMPEDMELDSPYNTYRHYGLPPGPICNPGKEALQAALNPADVKYLYFVHRGDGTHIFSNSLEEHNRAIWLLKKNKNS